MTHTLHDNDHQRGAALHKVTVTAPNGELWSLLSPRSADPEITCRQAFAEPRRVIKDQERLAVWQTPCGWIAKHYRASKGLLDSLRRSRKAQAALHAANTLIKRGVATPRPIAALRNLNRSGECLLLCESSTGQPIEQAANTTSQRAILQLSQDLALWLAEIHKRGVFHGDLKRSNLFLVPKNSFEIIDLDSLSLDPWPKVLARDRAGKDLGMLLSSLGGYLTHHDRLRFLARYAKARALSSTEAKSLATLATHIALRRDARSSQPKDGGWPHA